MKLKLENPKALDSMNMCMSGAHIRITFGKELETEYVYWASNNSYVPTYKITIEKNITPDKMVLVTWYANTNPLPLKETKIYVQLSMVKSKREFLDWLVKSIETEYTKNYVIV